MSERIKILPEKIVKIAAMQTIMGAGDHDVAEAPKLATTGGGKDIFSRVLSVARKQNIKIGADDYWRKAKASGAKDCIEVASTHLGVKIRDSKNKDLGSIAVSKQTFRELLY